MNNNLYLAYQKTLDRVEQLYCKNEHGYWNVANITDIVSTQSQVVDILLSAKNVVILSLTPPKNYEKYGKTLLLNLVENKIIEAISTVELFVLHKTKHSVTVAIINKKKWEAFKTHLTTHDLVLGNVWIDALCLPIDSNTASLFAINQNTVLWRSCNDDVFSGNLSLLEQTSEFKNCDTEWLTLQPERLTDSHQSVKQLLSYTKTTNHNLNLQKTSIRNRNDVKIVTVLAVFSVILWTTQLALSNRSQRRIAESYYENSKHLFKKIFPQAKKIPTRSYITRRIDTYSDRIKTTNTRNWHSMLKILNDTVENSDVIVKTISYYTQPMRLNVQLSFSDQSQMNMVKNNIDKTAKITTISEMRDSNGIHITWEIQ